VTNNFYHWFQVFTGAGFVVLAPNFRGSTGYGKAFQSLNQRDWGGASFRDMIAGADYLVESGWAHPRHLAVVGGSFGGFMALTAATQEPDRWAAIVDVFGPANLFTFIENTPAWWKPYLYDMVGHPERDRQQLEERSPVNFLDRAKAPMLVIQGAHDPRVTKGESDQVVERLRALGQEVDYLVFEDEGHGFSRTANEIRAAKAIVSFLDRHIGL
ncbi:MAG: S9 family peptidase, partial [Candidatus Sericytochromatia bacterium]|nr:S9 family peptidase [Candidatus Tanganyikabacteria bacterium]